MEKMISRLETILEKYEYLQNKLQEDEVINDIKQYTTYSKELAMLEKSAKKYLQYKKLIQDLQDAKL